MNLSESVIVDRFGLKGLWSESFRINIIQLIRRFGLNDSYCGYFRINYRSLTRSTKTADVSLISESVSLTDSVSKTSDVNITESV